MIAQTLSNLTLLNTTMIHQRMSAFAALEFQSFLVANLSGEIDAGHCRH